MEDESPLTMSMSDGQEHGSLPTNSDNHESEDPLAEAIQKWGRKHKSKARTLSRASLSCLQMVELNTIPAVETIPDKRERMEKFEDNMLLAATEGAAEFEAATYEEGRVLSPEEKKTSERRGKERRVVKGIIKLNIRQRLGAMFRTSHSANQEDTALSTSKATTLTMARGSDLFEGNLTSDMLRKIEDKMKIEGMRRKQAVIQIRLERMIQIHRSVDNALFFVLDKCPSQSETIELVKGLLNEDVDVSATDDEGRSPLHCVVSRNNAKFVHLANALLQSQASAEVRDRNGHLAVEIALEQEADEMSALILGNMAKARVRALFEPTLESSPPFNFYRMISSGNMVATCHAVLDSLVEHGEVPGEYVFYYRALEADDNGHLPSSPDFNGARTTFQLVTEHKELSSSNAVRMLIHRKWSCYGEKSAWRDAVLYFLFVFVSSFALISAAKQHVERFNATTREREGMDWSYKTSEAQFRGVCEIVALSWVALSFVGEFKELYQNGLKKYFLSPMNYVQMSTNILIVSLVPMRFLDIDEQYEVASVAYVFISLRMLNVVSITKIAGIYLQILIQIVIKDMISFIIIFSIFWVMFSGSFFLALASVSHSGNETGTTLDIHEEASDYFHILLTGLRIMVQEESVLEYIGQGYGFLAIILMMCFLFIVLIVILNILIAQLSDTYTDVKSDATRTVERNWAKALVSMEQADKFKGLRLRSFTSFEKVERPEGQLGVWDKPVNRQEALQAEKKERMVEQLEKQEQQLTSLQSQMRATISMVETEHELQQELQELLKNMIELQLPGILENVVQRNSAEVITSVDTTSKSSAVQLEQHIKNQVVVEVQKMIEGVTDDVVDRLAEMLSAEPPV